MSAIPGYTLEGRNGLSNNESNRRGELGKEDSIV
jgi:hypothetical protein